MYQPHPRDFFAASHRFHWCRAGFLAILSLTCAAGCYYFPPPGSTDSDEPPASQPEPPDETDDGRVLLKPAVGVYFTDFETAVGAEWSTDQRDAAPANLRIFLGDFVNDTVTLNLEALPDHTAVTIVADLYVIGSWDGNSTIAGPDVWSLTTGDGNILIETTFSYTELPRQAYPNSYPFGRHPGRSGAIENNSLGYSFIDNSGNVQQWNSVYQIRSTFDHDADSLALHFAARGLEDESESWGLDNVSVALTPPDGDWETVLVIEAEDFATRATGGSVPEGWNVWHSGRITDWVRCHPQCTNVRVTGVVRGQPAHGHWPIMGITINQRFEARAIVAQISWMAHAFEMTLEPGLQQIGFAFTNDEPPAPGQDRNLIVDRLEIAVPAGTPPEHWPTREPRPDFMTEPVVPENDDAVMALARQNIEDHRKGTFQIRLLNADGSPLPNQAVQFDMIRHHFLWGTAVRFDLEDPDRPIERWYRRRLAEMFNYGTTESAMRWGYFESERGFPRFDEVRQYLDICDDLGIELKAHNLVWGHFLDIPTWFTEDDINNADALLDTRVRDIVDNFRGRFSTYDVVNEPLHALQWEYWAGPGIVEDSLRRANESDPDATLLVNEFEIVAVPDMADNFYVRMRDLINRGAPLGGVGIQLHANLGEWYLPRDIWRGFERMAQLGVEVHLTEVSLGADNTFILGGPNDGMPWTDDLQAEYYEQVMTLAFGHPAIDSMTYWGFSDRRHFQPGSGLLDLSFRPKAAGLAYQRLLNETWSTHEQVTTDADGVATLRAFYGWYRISHGDRIAIVEFVPDDSDAPIDVLQALLYPLGDDNRDGRVDESDLPAFIDGFTDVDVYTVLPSHAHLDFDGDRDIDCDDWNRFVTAWSGGTTPQFPPCTNPEPTVEATGCRYLTLTPPEGDAPIAFEVTSDDWLCVVKFVNASGGLVNDPFFQTPAEWGIVDVSDGLIVPDARYNVRAFDGEHLTRRATARTWIWGDADNDGDSDDDDVRLVVDAFHGEFSDLPYQRVDIASCVPNRAVDFDDVTAVINAAAGIPYAAVCPDPCNHEGDVWASPDDASP